jgi:O-antigen ligase
MSTLCLVALPLVAVLGAREIRRGSSASGLNMWVAALAIGVLVVMIGVIRSRTGIVLAGPVLVASFLAAWVGAGRGRPHPFLLGGAAAAAVAIAVIGFAALGPIIERFDRLASSEGRLENWPIVAEAAERYLPLGSGLGSFDAVYRSVEPLSTLDPTFFNQAHNDYLELWLETGWVGAILLIGFAIWFLRRALSAWRATPSTTSDLGRAATIAIVAVLAHSAVDYPLRTVALATVFALLCALVEVSVGPSGPARRRAVSRG